MANDYTNKLADDIYRLYPSPTSHLQLIKDTIQYLDNAQMLDNTLLESRYNVNVAVAAERRANNRIATSDQKASPARKAAENAGVTKSEDTK